MFDRVRGGSETRVCLGPAQGRWVDLCWLIAALPGFSLSPHLCIRRRFATWPLLCFRSLRYNSLGSEGGVAIGEALKVNTSVQTIQ